MTARYGLVVDGKLAVLYDGQVSPIEINGERIPFKYLPSWEQTEPEQLAKRGLVSLAAGEPPRVDPTAEVVLFKPAVVGSTELKHGWEVKEKPEPTPAEVIDRKAEALIGGFFRPVYDRAEELKAAQIKGRVVDTEKGTIDGAGGWPVL